MPKHTPVTMTLSDIIDRIEKDTDTHWSDVMCIDIPGYEDALDRDAENDNNGIESHEAHGVEIAYINAHINDLYEVSWPQHVCVPHFNSDASYIPQAVTA